MAIYTLVTVGDPAYETQDRFLFSEPAQADKFVTQLLTDEGLQGLDSEMVSREALYLYSVDEATDEFYRRLNRREGIDEDVEDEYEHRLQALFALITEIQTSLHQLRDEVRDHARSGFHYTAGTL